MSLSGAMFSGVSGLDAISTAISVIGDNIANQNTPGFKASRVAFSDVLGQTITSSGGFSQVGAGTTVTRVQPLFTQGTFENTTQNTDLAIEGQGLFVLEGASGRQYTRVGIFSFDNQGTLVDEDGQRVQGFGIDQATGIPNGQLDDIVITNGLAPPSATSDVTFNLNLNAGETAIPTGFDITDPNASSQFRGLITAYDSLGNARPVTVFFTKTASATWEWNATTIPSDTTTAPTNPTDAFVSHGSGTINFDPAGNGTLAGVTGNPISFDFADGATPGQNITFDFGPVGQTLNSTTQFSDAESVLNSSTQNGASAGNLVTLEFTIDGFVSGLFSNGAIVPIAQVALAQFPNLEGLQSVGNNNLIETRPSGQPIVGAPNTGQFGNLLSSTVEQSNVDLANEFVRLIIYQRAFQANTRTISTSNELLANLLTLGQ